LTEELDELLSKDPLKYRDELTHEIAAYHTLKPQPDGSWLTKETASGLNAITLLELVIKDGARDSNLASLKKILTGASSGK
jgi:hypothetical protein